MRLSRRREGEESLRQPLPLGRLGAFAVVGLLCAAYILFSVVGAKTFEGSYHVTVDMPVTGGLFPGSQVTYRGVPVGSVSAISISADRTHVVATLNIHDGVHIPVTTNLVVADRSPAGEQYIDFQPYAASPRFLRDGSIIPASQTRRPPSLADLLSSVATFSDSVNLRELRTVFNELDTAFGGTGRAIGRIIDNSERLITSLETVEPATIDLLRTAGQVLDTQAAHDGDLRQFSVSLRELADTLRTDSPHVAHLIDVALQTAQQVGPLLRQDTGNIGMLLVNLVTVGHIAVQRLPGLNALLVSLPGGLHALATAVHGNHVNFQLLDQLGTVCRYPHTRREQPYDPHRGPPITNGYCLHPTKGEQQRGAVYAPRPPGDTTAGPAPAGSTAAHASTNRPRAAATAPADSDSWLQVFTAGER